MPDKTRILFLRPGDFSRSPVAQNWAWCWKSTCRENSSSGFGVLKKATGSYFPWIFGKVFGVGVYL
jgi:hypothetical protein